MQHREYLLSYGNAGEFGRFQAAEALGCRRGDRLVVRSPRGQEIGVVLRPATAMHAHLLEDRYVGQILRCATPGDFELAERMQRRSQALFADAHRTVTDMHLPLEILDAEILIDGRQAILHYLRWTDCDARALMEPLSKKYRLLITLHDLAIAAAEPEPEVHGACGSGGCGSGGCGSCGSGGCSTCVNHAVPTKRAVGRPGQEEQLVSAVLESSNRLPLL